LGGRCGTTALTAAYDANGNAWVAGNTDSRDFPVTKDALQATGTTGDIDGFVARFSPSGALDYATYIAGPQFDTVSGLTFDAKGNLYLTGTSKGLTLSASAGAFQPKANATCVIFSFGPGVYQAVGNGFVLKLDPTAHTMLGLTYLGAPLCLDPANIAVDASGQPWIAGPLSIYGSSPQTASPLQIGANHGFVSKFSADLTQLLFSTYFDSVSDIAVDSSGLAHVTGKGTVDNAGNSQAYIATIDSTPAAISLDGVLNAVKAGSPSNAQGITAGELLQITGKNMGPARNTPGVINGGLLASTVAGVQVTFDGVPVPLLSVSATEIDLIAPFELDGKSTTTIQVLYQNAKSNPVQVAIGSGISISGTPTGTQLQILGVYNSDLTVNSASNPAAAGSVMTLLVAGVGQSAPASQDGQINSFPLAATPFPAQVLLPFVDANNRGSLPVTYSGAAPQLVAGVYQINFIAPQQSLTNLTLTIGQAFGLFDVAVK